MAAPHETVPVADALLAATAAQNGLTLLTRHKRRFTSVEAPVFDSGAAA